MTGPAAGGRRPRVVLLRGHHPTVFGLRPYEQLLDRFDVRLAVTDRTLFDLSGLRIPQIRARTLRDLLPPGPPGGAIAIGVGDRLLRPEQVLRGADVVHTEELSFWFSAQAARLKHERGYRLVVTVWETIPMLDAYRFGHARRFRAETLEAADVFLAATERAREGLLLEGVTPERIVVIYPGVDVDRFAAARPLEAPPARHVVVSPGRLAWEKGHHDVLRALAALRRGLVPAPQDAVKGLRLLIVGSGPERERLLEHARELGVADAVEIKSVPYDEMPSVYAEASAMVLASLPSTGCSLWPGDVPRCFWEEQFGLVLAEAMAAGLPLVLSRSGAIPEVAGESAQYFAPGDWMGIARELGAGPLLQPPGRRAKHPPERVALFASAAAAGRIAAGYQRALA